MFDVLPESAAPTTPRAWGSRIASLAVHAVIIAAAIRLTDGAAAQVPDEGVREDTLIYTLEREPRPRPPAPPAPRPTAMPGLPAPAVPDPVLDIPGVIAPPAESVLMHIWNTRDTASVFGRDTTGAPQPAAPGGRVLDERLADDRPELVWHPPLRYPDVMRLAGIEARVVVEAVLDTTGRVERGSLRATGGAHALFEAAARDVVQASRYRPARLAGRAVRVRIQVPVSFALSR